MCIATDMVKYGIGQIWRWKDCVDKNICQSPVLRGDRPVLIIGYINEIGYRGRATVLPITHAKSAAAKNQLDRFFLHPIKLDDSQGYIECNQPMTVPVINLESYMGTITPQFMANVFTTLNKYLIKGLTQPLDVPEITADYVASELSLNTIKPTKSKQLEEPALMTKFKTAQPAKKREYHKRKIYNPFDNQHFENMKDVAAHYHIGYGTVRRLVKTGEKSSIGQLIVETDSLK